ncbi:MAG: class II glutamine amidotransferase [Wenzhouxiangellaceae bacterium]
MCRFTFYLGPEIRLASLVTQPAHSLINQSYNAQERPEPLNGDGFGLAWYGDTWREPARFRSITPAWNNANLRDLAWVCQSHCILAHVRAATLASEVMEPNCHPFRCGPFSFMHNGNVDGFKQLRRALLGQLSDEGFQLVRGTTDSEHVFALAMEHLRGHEEDSTCDLLAHALEQAITALLTLNREHAPGEHCYLNLVLSDGWNAAACRFSTDENYIDTLYLSHGKRYRCEDQQCVIDEVDDVSQQSILLSSEPLSDDEGWAMVPRNHVVLINSERQVTVRPMQVNAAV